MKKVGFAGTFDIFTNGHLWTVQQMVGIADKAVVIIAENPSKKTMFSLVERVSIIESIIESQLGCYEVDVVVVREDYVAEWANREGIRLVRGIRNGADFEYEKKLNYSNSTILGADPTLFLIPPDNLANISSSFIKGWIGPIGWHNRIKSMLPEETYQAVIEKWLEHQFKSSIAELRGSIEQNDHNIESMFTDVISAYSERDRTYHNLAHLVHMISELQRARLNSTQLAEAIQTAFWHDLFMKDPNCTVSGEEASASFVEAYLGELIEFHYVWNIADNVRNTAHASRDKTKVLGEVAAAVISADFAILGRPGDEYSAYKTRVREEFKQYSFVDYAKGRCKFLEEMHSLAFNKKLFPHPTFSDIYSESAMNNLYLELTALSQSLEIALIAQ